MPDRNAIEIVDREYLELRAKVLELAATYDRIERASGECVDERLQKIAKGLEILKDDEGDKAKRVQLLFSRDYSQDWRNEFGL